MSGLEVKQFKHDIWLFKLEKFQEQLFWPESGQNPLWSFNRRDFGPNAQVLIYFKIFYIIHLE